MDDLLSTSEAAALLGITVGHVHKLVQTGRLAVARRYPRLLLFSREELARCDTSRRPPGRPRRPEGAADADA